MNHRRNSPAGSAFAALLTLGAAMPAVAEWQPNRPITHVVAFGTGGGTDTIARAFASSATENLAGRCTPCFRTVKTAASATMGPS